MSDIQNKTPQTAKDRLAQISHHFLSDAEDDVVTDQLADEWPPEAEAESNLLKN